MHRSAFININGEVYIFIMKFGWKKFEGQEVFHLQAANPGDTGGGFSLTPKPGI